LEERELASGVDCLEFFRIFGFFGNNLNIDVLAIELSGNSSDEGVEVKGVINVDFLKLYVRTQTIDSEGESRVCEYLPFGCLYYQNNNLEKQSMGFWGFGVLGFWGL